MAQLMKVNAELREQIEEKDRTIATLQLQVTKRKKPPLNKECSKQVRQITKKLKEEHLVTFDFNFGASHTHNAQIINRIVEEAMGSANSKTFSKHDAEEATLRYFTNLRDDHKRRINGTKEKHLKCMRRASRMETKLRMRLSGLQSEFCQLPPAQKEKAQEIMHLEYMSSDEDEVEKGVDGTEYRNVKMLPLGEWRGSTYQGCPTRNSCTARTQ